ERHRVPAAPPPKTAIDPTPTLLSGPHSAITSSEKAFSLDKAMTSRREKERKPVDFESPQDQVSWREVDQRIRSSSSSPAATYQTVDYRAARALNAASGGLIRCRSTIQSVKSKSNKG
ncbi:MAG TPA: hypothetical protein VM715_15060, partial [Candidatus Acidoferrum sp.]|nr:hypothetical protein [Candidatus Acidoferrum sp.]